MAVNPCIHASQGPKDHVIEHSPSTCRLRQSYQIFTGLICVNMRQYLIPSPRSITRRPFSAVSRRRMPSPFISGPSPPRLPENEQKVFEELQRSSTGAFSTPRESREPNGAPSPFLKRPQINQSPANSDCTSSATSDTTTVNAKFRATGNGEELHPDVRRGARPEFEGDRNPKTGEVGGPKNEPLRWGGEVDWSYNGRVTDF